MKKLLLALLLLPAAATARPLAFVINSSEASVSLIDMDTHAEIKRIPVLREPHHMALSPDGASLLVGDTAGNAVFMLDPNTGEVLALANAPDYDAADYWNFSPQAWRDGAGNVEDAS